MSLRVPPQGMMPGKQQRGVALVIVVWFIAGMALLVSGIVAQARVDNQLAQLHVARAKAVAAGDGAIQLAMLERAEAGQSGEPSGKAVSSKHRVGDIQVEVSLQDTAGLLDLNVATHKQLTALLSMTKGAGGSEAKRLADSVVEWRQGLRPGGARPTGKSRFYSPEDLLQVPGFDRSALDGIRDYVVAGKLAGGALDMSVAPEQLRNALGSSAGNSSQVDSPQVGAASGTYRVDAIVLYGDQRWLRRRWISARSSTYSRLPWRTLRTEAPRIYEG
ncbi:MAG: type II secretory pathway component PulK [Alcanivorax sp.]|jgi:type II secretory pathway component PulK